MHSLRNVLWVLTSYLERVFLKFYRILESLRNKKVLKLSIAKSFSLFDIKKVVLIHLLLRIVLPTQTPMLELCDLRKPRFHSQFTQYLALVSLFSKVIYIDETLKLLIFLYGTFRNEFFNSEDSILRSR